MIYLSAIPQSTAIMVSKALPLTDRIAQASLELNQWLSTLEKPLNRAATCKVRLAGVEYGDGKSTYRYEVLRRDLSPAACALAPES